MARFVMIEGIDGSGKSTLSSGLHVSDIGVEAGEFSTSSLGDFILNQLSVRSDVIVKDLRAQVFLFVADYFEKLGMASECDELVLVDRGNLTKLSYQFLQLEESYGPEVATIFSSAVQAMLPTPVATIFLKVDDFALRERLAERRAEVDLEGWIQFLLRAQREIDRRATSLESPLLVVDTVAASSAVVLQHAKRFLQAQKLDS